MPRRPSSAALRRGLVEGLEASGNVTDPAVRKAFLTVPRERFLPGWSLEEVYENRVIVTRKDSAGAPISSSSQPAIMAIMLERLELAPGLRVLEIGAGTGYNAALLSTLVGEEGRVTSVELEPDLASTAAAALAEAGYRAEVVTGDGRDGWPAGAPYDRIVLTASTDTVCRTWFDQLAPAGLLQLPMHLKGPDLQAVVTLRKEDGLLRSTDVVEGGFMVLRERSGESRGRLGANLSVDEHVDGKHRSFGSLFGEQLRRLDPSARRRLAMLMLEKARARRVSGPSGAGRSPALWLRLARPTRAIVAGYFRSGLEKSGRWGVAVAGVDGRSLAVVVLGRGGIRLEAYGEGRAEEVLIQLLDDWRERGRPGTRDLDVTVTFRDGSPRTDIGWRHGASRAQSSTVRARR